MSPMKRVLVVDDDPVVGQSFDRVLSPKGYAVISAADGAEALERLAREDYDLVYTDIRMPGMSGIEVARSIRASRPWLPVVIVTGYGGAEHERAAREAGVTAFLEKPLTPQMIEDTAAAFVTNESLVTQVLESPVAMEAAPVATAMRPRGAALTFARNVALFVLAPAITIAYVVLGPLVGLGMLAWFGGKAILERANSRRG